MSTDWQTVRIGDLGKVITGKTPSTAISENFGGPYPFITIPDLDDRREITASARTLSELGAHAMRSCRLPSNAVMMSCIATVGKCGITTKESFTNQQINSLICKDGVEPRFVYYSFTQLGKALEAAGGGGSVYTNVSKSRFEAIEIRLPPLKEQRSIAEILSILDDKLDLNRRINQTLEAMAQAIFKSWFVDFDPVKAKIAARARWHAMQPGNKLASPVCYAEETAQLPDLETFMTRAAMRAISGKTDAELDQMPREHHNHLAATAALFPDEMQDSELGEIPKGWEVGTFKKCCLRVESGGTPNRKESVFWDGSIPWLTSGEVRDVVVLDTKEKITSAGLESSSAKLWPPMTTVVAMYGATAGQVCLLANEMTANQACCALIPHTEFRAFIFISARQSIQQLAEKASGSAQQNLNKYLVENHIHLIPDAAVAGKFDSTTSPLLQQWIQNKKETAVLEMVRNTLLPKLLSGELLVDNPAEGSV